MPDHMNDNGALSAPALHGEADAHGKAALLLVESLIHGLIARSVISVVEAIEIVNIAAEAKAEIAFEISKSGATMNPAVDLLAAISASLNVDAPRA